MNIVDNARELAYKWHEGQMYGDKPYGVHLQDVVDSLYKKHGVDEALLATGYLHDILEDTECTWEEIEDACGERVLEAVVALTKFQDERYEPYICALILIPAALEVKLHDTLCNLTASVMSGEKGRIRKYAKQLQLLVED